MARIAVVHTTLPDSRAAGTALGQDLLTTLDSNHPDAVIVFASPRYEYTALLEALQAAAQPGTMIGCSSAGEFTGDTQAEGSACAVALLAPEMRFAAAIGRGLRADREGAARELANGLHIADASEYRYRNALVFADALVGHTDDLIEDLTLLTAGTYQFVGGGAADDAKFECTHVFYGTEAVSNAAVALEVLSNKPVGIGVRHGWQPASDAMRVTEADGMDLVSLNAIPAAEVMEEHAERTGQRWDPQVPLPFFLQNVIGIESGGGYKLRVPLAVEPNGALACAADVPRGASAHIMASSAASAAEAAAGATEDALHQLGEHRPAGAIFFDCVATRLRTGREFGVELDAVQRALGNAPFAGCNTYGQIARAEGQFNGFHNCTAVVFVLPE